MSTWDFITVVENADQPRRYATKVYRDDAYGEPAAWSDGFFWNSERFDVASFAELVDVIEAVKEDPFTFVIHGRAKPGQTDAPHVKRKHDKGDGFGAPYEDAPHRYLIGDWDDCAEPLDVNDVEGSVARARATLPELLRGAECAFFLSASAHRKGTVRGKWIFPLDRIMAPKELEAHAFALGFDGSVCRTVQPNFFADPVFKFCTDPLAGKRGAIRFAGGVVSLPATAPKEAAASPVALANVEPTADDEIGAVIGTQDSYAKRRHDLAGALGGELRRLSVSQARAEALGRAYFGAEKFREHGPWMMGAFAKAPLEVSGREALAEIVGAEKAEAFARTFAPFKGAIAPATPSAPSEGETAGDGLRFATDEPLFVIHRGSVWILDNAGGYSPPVAARDLKPALAQKNLLQFFANENGSIPKTEAIYEMGGLVSEFEKDFRAPLTTVRGSDSARLVLVEGHRTRPIDPAFDAEVEEWLALLFGDGLDDAYVWIAACAQRYLDRPAACFIHLGPPDVGKSLIYSVLAYMWNATAPVDLGSAIARFNGKTTRCPIVLDDEARELAREKISTRDFRELVAAGVRDVELKGRECSLLLGCLRYAVTANGVHQLQFTDVDGAATLAALDTRIALHVTPDEAHDAAVAALARLRVNPEIDRADVPRIAGHFAWVQETVEVPARRFLGGRDKGGPSAVLAGHARRFTEVFEKIHTLLDAGLSVDGAGAIIRARDGRMLVSTVKLAALFPFDREALRHVQEALRPLRVAIAKYSVTKKNENMASYWAIDEEKLTYALTFL